MFLFYRHSVGISPVCLLNQREKVSWLAKPSIVAICDGRIRVFDNRSLASSNTNWLIHSAADIPAPCLHRILSSCEEIPSFSA